MNDPTPSTPVEPAAASSVGRSALAAALRPAAQRHRQMQLAGGLVRGWLVALSIALLAWAATRITGWSSPLLAPVVAVAGIAVALVLTARRALTPPDQRALARAIEQQHPDLRGLLLTAVQQEPGSDGRLGYLQQCVVRDAVSHGTRHDWAATVSPSRLRWTHAAHVAVALAFLGIAWNLRVSVPAGEAPSLLVRTGGITVTPGDATVERGTSLVILARFGSAPPASAELVMTPVNTAPGAAAPERRLALTRSLADPVFGGTIPEVPGDFTYRVEFAGEKTREYAVKVFEFPRLERSDASLTFPDYTRESPKRIENTRRVGAVEGTRVELSLQLNKPVATARLVSKDASLTNVALAVVPNRPLATLPGWVPSVTATYDLQLVDADGRTNREPAQFVFQVLTNRTPELKLVSPRGDIRPSALEEIAFEGTVWDDFGTVAYGLAYTHSGADPQFLEFGRDVPARERRTFRHLLRLEELGAHPDELLSWYIWADDIGPDGKVRRTAGDLYFAEVRPFEEVFRESSRDSNEQQGQGGQGSPSSRLSELQKQIVNATWKLQREAPRTPAKKLAADTAVVRDSQAQAIEQASSARDEDQDPRSEAMWDAAISAMKEAKTHLDAATTTPAELAPALKSEQSAYQALLRLREREIQIARSRSRQGGGGGAGQEMRDRQLEQLDFTAAENRYETQSQAQAPTDPARREQLQVLNRLQELARRQEDVNERLKELQTALREADTEKEREELRRQLKRLQEEQQQMLADMDELQQRMNRSESQSRMAEQRQQLDQTRQDMQRSADATAEGSMPQALASGTRAQRQLQEVRDQIRKDSSSQFAEDLRQMRAESRELARKQEELNRDLDAPRETSKQPTLAPREPKEDLAERLADQKRRLTNIVSRGMQVSQASETTEPVVSHQLEETLRRLNQDESASVTQLQNDLVERGLMTRSLLDRLRNKVQADDAKSLEATAEMMRQGLGSEALQAGRRAQGNFDTLQKGVARAAESVLGDDLEALRQARAQLDQLTSQLEREIARATGQTNQGGGAASGNASTNAGPRQLASNNARSNNRQPGNQGERQGQQGQGQQDANQQDPGQQGQGQQGQGQQGQGQQGQGQQGQGQQGQGQQGQGQQGQGQQGQGQQGQGQQGQGQQGQGQQGQGQQGQGQQGQGQQGQGQQGQGGQPGGQQAGQQGQPNSQPGRQQDARQRGQNGNPNGRNTGQNREGGTARLGAATFLRGPNFVTDNTGPIEGTEFGPWSDNLREVEEMIDLPELRDDVAQARERARQVRQEWRQAGKKPDWAVVRQGVLGPLTEVRNRISDELARRDGKDPLVPIDRDPVPNRFSDVVRRYYEELGKDH